MKYLAALPLAALPLAALLALGTVSTANAWSMPHAMELQGAQTAEATGETDVWHHCHGLSSGTASDACGTRTGGPSGGLF